MIAASAGFPVLIGPYTLKTGSMNWNRDKFGYGESVDVEPKYTLWDGGVYDNLGLEALYKIGRGLDIEIDFLIVSDASSSIGFKKRKRTASLSNMKRLLDISMYQVYALRSREFHAAVTEKKQGMYLRIGSTTEKIATEYGIPAKDAAVLFDELLPIAEAERAKKFHTTLRTPNESDFDLILRHGYETAKCVQCAQKVHAMQISY